MKIDANVLVRNGKGAVSDGAHLDIAIDEDYIGDGDDIINAVEARLNEDYGVSLYVGEDIEITNYEEICDEIFNG